MQKSKKPFIECGCECSTDIKKLGSMSEVHGDPITTNTTIQTWHSGCFPHFMRICSPCCRCPLFQKIYPKRELYYTCPL